MIGHRRPGSSLAPLLFATTNIAKFLQARLVLTDAGYNVQRLEAHLRPYAEPYGRPTDEFLMAGIEEVVSRAGRTRLLFIEDTTLQFPSLSEDGEEFPGQRAKEWFAESSHMELLETLDAAGGDRRVIVRSDIALYVPGLQTPVLVSATTSGTVVERLQSVTVNRLYPWLGRPDFSSWFVPDGASKVLAAMQLEESLRYDFRAKSLAALSERLNEYVAVLNLPDASIQRARGPIPMNPAQVALAWDTGSDLVLAVIGAMSSGKTTVGHFLALHRDFYHIEGSRALLEAARDAGIYESASYFDLADALFDDRGNDAVEREVVIPILKEAKGPIVYTGCRTLEGLAALKEASWDLGRRFSILYLSTTSSLRLARATDRAREDSTIDPLQFERMCQRDEAYGAVSYGRQICDVHVKNETELEPFLARVNDVVGQLRSGDWLGNRKRRGLAAVVNEAASDEELIELLGRTSADFVSGLESDARLTTRGAALVSLLREDSREA